MTGLWSIILIHTMWMSRPRLEVCQIALWKVVVSHLLNGFGIISGLLCHYRIGHIGAFQTGDDNMKDTSEWLSPGERCGLALRLGLGRHSGCGPMLPLNLSAIHCHVSSNNRGFVLRFSLLGCRHKGSCSNRQGKGSTGSQHYNIVNSRSNNPFYCQFHW